MMNQSVGPQNRHSPGHPSTRGGAFTGYRPYAAEVGPQVSGDHVVDPKPDEQ